MTSYSLEVLLAAILGGGRREAKLVHAGLLFRVLYNTMVPVFGGSGFLCGVNVPKCSETEGTKVCRESFSPTVVSGEAVIKIKQCTHTSVRKHIKFQYEWDIVSCAVVTDLVYYSARRGTSVSFRRQPNVIRRTAEVYQISSKVFQRFKEVI